MAKFIEEETSEEEEGTLEEIEEEEPESEVEDTEDGGAVIRYKEDDKEDIEEHFANIVDDVDQGELDIIVFDLLEKIERDRKAREKRDELYEEGLRRTGLSDDAPGGAQFTGASRVVHPMLVESCVDFSARVTKELFPSHGPVKSKIIGQADSEKLAKAQRKTDFMNWQLTEQMPEFRPELEQLTTQVPLGGGQYLKMYWNPNFKRPTSEFIPIDDLYLPFAATNFYTAERRTHAQYVTAMTFNKRVAEGMYREVDLAMPKDPEYSRASEANDKIEGREVDAYNEDGLRTVYETYTWLEIEGDLKPYIISIDDSTEQAIALYRNWDPEDELFQELEWIVEWPFVPWRGAYPIGLTHMIGSLAASSTGALRALLDTAHINNIPTMLKLKGGPNGQTLELSPTEVTEIDGGGLSDDIRKLVMPVPFNPPSQTLYQLLGFLVDAGKGVVQTSFEKLSDTSQQQPVGTTMALIEQGMSVFSSIHNRLHGSMSRALKILHRINAAYLTEELIETHCKGFDIKPEDFEGPMDIVPVSDPHIFSETQRFAQIQAILERASTMPQLYDVRKTEELFIRQMKLKPEDVLVDQPGKEDRDPVSENVAASMGQPVYVLPKQNHAGHLQIHLAFLQSPVFGKNPMMQPALVPAMAIHLRDHVLNYYLTQASEGVKLAKEQGKMVQESDEQEVLVVKNVQRAIEQEFQGLTQTLVEIDKLAKQLAQQAGGDQPQDSSMAVAKINAELQTKLQEMKNQVDQMKLQADSQKQQSELEFKKMKLQMDTQLNNQKLQQAAMEKQQKTTLDKKELEQEAVLKREELEAKEAMNASDNQTALIISDIDAEKSNIKTGTGINPDNNPNPGG